MTIDDKTICPKVIIKILSFTYTTPLEALKKGARGRVLFKGDISKVLPYPKIVKNLPRT